MLSPATPYPHVGSYCLVDHEGQTQLARIQFRRVGEVVVSLPLVDGAGGTLRVADTDLADGTPLTADELREFHDLDRHLADRSLRTPKQKRQKARRDALKSRLICSRLLDLKLRELGARPRKAA
jgi:hypothetical protein